MVYIILWNGSYFIVMDAVFITNAVYSLVVEKLYENLPQAQYEIFITG